MLYMSELATEDHKYLWFIDSLKTLDTPCLVINSQTLSANVSRLAEYAARHGVEVRPHTKTHKSLKIARMQIDAGAVGLTVAKPGEARVMAGLGAPTLIAYPSVTGGSLAAINDIASIADTLVALDSLEACERLVSSLGSGVGTVGVLVDVNVGMNRTGVGSLGASLAIAQYADRSDRLRLEGIFCYPGHVWESADEQGPPLAAVNAILAAHREAWSASGLEVRRVSGGSTPTAYQTHLAPLITEIRPGTYVFNDMNTVRGGYCSLDDCALRVLTTVVSDAVTDQIVIDAGTKALSSDRCLSDPDLGHGMIVEFPDAQITRLSEEHGQVDVSRCARRPRVGDRLTVIPNHVCPAVNLADFAWWVQPDGEVQSLKIDTRGMVR